ncbi:MAG: hypothetical protein DRJ13_11780, partial [Bacteroidetes bacterium]
VILFIYNKLGIQPFTAKTLKIFLLISMAFLINFLLPTLDSWFLDSLYRSVIVAGLFIIVTYYYKLSEDLNSVVRSVFNLLGIGRGSR